MKAHTLPAPRQGQRPPPQAQRGAPPAQAERAADAAAARALAIGAAQAGCACGGGCPRCRPAPAEPGSTAAAPAPLRPALAEPGRPLPPATRARLEPGLGAGLAGVRLHDGPGAQAVAAAHGTPALAWGEHVVLGHGAGALPLLAHELAHVVQQRGQAPWVQRKEPAAKPAAPTDDAAFEEWWKKVVGYEGSLKDWEAQPANQADRGGPTQYGITQDSYMRHAPALGLPATVEGFRAMTPALAMRFGRMMWKASGASRLKNTGVAMVLADWYWGGITLRRLTALLKAKGHTASYDKGSPSQATTDFMNTLDPGELVALMSDAKAEQYKAHVKADASQQPFLKGWLKRSEERRAQAQPFVTSPVKPAAQAAPAGPKLSPWDMTQRALRLSRNAQGDDERAQAKAAIWEALTTLDQLQIAGARHAEEADAWRRLKAELFQELKQYMP